MTVMTNIKNLIEKLQQLENEREELVKKPMSPPGVWIHQYMVRKRYPDGFIGEYIYAKWQAEEPIFRRNPKKFGHRGKGEFTCHQHIGRVDSNTGLGMDERVEEAYEEWENRKRLDAIDQALKEIEIALMKVMPQEANEA
jgi:hypothetical protein